MDFFQRPKVELKMWNLPGKKYTQPGMNYYWKISEIKNNKVYGC
jgi:hypothetical protein